MKWYVYLICAVFVILGLFAGIDLVKFATSESYVNGSIDIENQLVKSSFSYSSNSVVFYKDAYVNDSYSFVADLTKVEGFDGEIKSYDVLLNDFVLFNSDVYPGYITSEFCMDFYDTEGNIVCSGDMDIKIEFLNDKTRLSLATDSIEEAKFFEQYFKDYGIRLKVKEISL